MIPKLQIPTTEKLRTAMTTVKRQEPGLKASATGSPPVWTERPSDSDQATVSSKAWLAPRMEPLAFARPDYRSETLFAPAIPRAVAD